MGAQGRDRFAGRRAVIRVIAVWIVTAATLVLLAAIMKRFSVDGGGAAIVAAAAIGLVNALVWPLVIRIALPFTVLTLGLGVLLLNGAVVLLVSVFDTGITVDGLGAGIVVAIGITLVNSLATALLAIDDDDFYYRNVIRREARRHAATSADSDIPGVYFLEIDGLAHGVVQRAIRDGHAPTLARWLRDGSHRLIGWETDWSSQTGACQAGLLHGSNDDMPAFRWWEKDRNAAIVTNHPKDATEIERRHSDGRGLLHEDGASRANILSGDAPHTLLTMSTVLDRDPARAPRPGLLRLLRQPLQRHPHVLPGDRRHRPGALLRVPAAPPRHQAADQAQLQLRVRARLGDRRPARPPGGRRDRRPLRRPAGRLHDLPRLRRGRPPLRRRADRRADDPAARRPPARPDRVRRCGRVAPVPVRGPLRSRPVPGSDLPHPLRRLARGSRDRRLRCRRRRRRGAGRALGRGDELPRRRLDRGRRPQGRGRTGRPDGDALEAGRRRGGAGRGGPRAGPIRRGRRTTSRRPSSR